MFLKVLATSAWFSWAQAAVSLVVLSVLLPVFFREI